MSFSDYLVYKIEAQQSLNREKVSFVHYSVAFLFVSWLLYFVCLRYLCRTCVQTIISLFFFFFNPLTARIKRQIQLLTSPTSDVKGQKPKTHIDTLTYPLVFFFLLTQTSSYLTFFPLIQTDKFFLAFCPFFVVFDVMFVTRAFLQNQHEDLKRQYYDLHEQHQVQGKDHSRLLGEHKERYDKLQEAKEIEVSQLKGNDLCQVSANKH